MTCREKGRGVLAREQLSYGQLGGYRRGRDLAGDGETQYLPLGVWVPCGNKYNPGTIHLLLHLQEKCMAMGIMLVTKITQGRARQASNRWTV